MSVNTPASCTYALRLRLGRPSGPARVNPFKCLTHVGHGEGEWGPVVLGSGRHRWHCVILKAGKEGVSFVWKQDVGVRDVAGFLFVVRDCL